MALTWLINFRVEARKNQCLMKQLASTMGDDNQFLISPTPLTVAPIPTINTTPIKDTILAEFENETEKADEIPQILQQFRELYHQNSDVFAWVSIDGTNINYPVMYTPDDGEYYLHRNFNKEDEKRGLPFLDAKTTLDLSQNYLIYGHNMKDGTGFHDLLNYAEESYYKEHSIIHFSTMYEEANYEIIAVLKTQIFYENQDVFKFYKFINIVDEAEFNEYMKNINEQSLYDTGINATFGDKLLTLSTCSYHTQDGRFVIVAKKKLFQ